MDKLCKDNLICCDDNCKRCANLIYKDYLKLKKGVIHGEWIPIVSYFHGKPDGRYYCSECRRVVDKYENYCPACGAKMDGGKKE